MNPHVGYLSSIPLSRFYSYNAFKSRPYIALLYPLLYPIEVIYNTLVTLIYRVVLFVYLLIILLVNLCFCSREVIMDRFALLGASLLSIATAIIGVVIPILSYRIDEKVARKYPDHVFFLGYHWCSAIKWIKNSLVWPPEKTPNNQTRWPVN